MELGSHVSQPGTLQVDTIVEAVRLASAAAPLPTPLSNARDIGGRGQPDGFRSIAPASMQSERTRQGS